MKLPFTKEEAEQQWKEFEEYLIKERYSVRDPESGEPVEHTYDNVLDRITECFENKGVREALRERKIITATPFLMNGGNTHTHRKGFYSCYPLGDVEDSTDSIFQMERNLATVFQHAGGGGIDVSNLRPAGSPVDNGQGNASGPVSFAKGYSHLSSRISQGGKRRGALMIQMDHTHHDIQEFIKFKGDSKGIFNGCNVSVNIVDDTFWNYEWLINLVAEYMWKSGDPGLLFTERSVKNTPVPAEFNPVFSNPCVPFETRVLTSEGYEEIGVLARTGLIRKVWNGKKWSKVRPFYTGTQHLLKVSFSDGTSLRCTKYHQFILKDSTRYNGKEYRSKACDLKIGDRLQKFDMPIVKSGWKYKTHAYSQGFYSGDGTRNQTRSKVYHTKYSCIDRLKGDILESSTRDDFKHWIHESMDKDFVPVNGSLEYCLDWLAGLFDADGTVTTYDNSSSLQLASINRKFLLDVRLMLTRLGVQAKVGIADGRKGYKYMPDGNGGMKEYYCQDIYRLLINTTDTVHLLDLGLKFNRLDVLKTKPQRDARRFVTVTAIEEDGFEDVYCFTEEKNHSGTFEGIVTGQCGEYLSIKNTACNLLSVNLIACLEDGQENFLNNVVRAARAAAIAGNEILDMGGFPPIPEIKEATLKHRPIGVGFTGLHAAMVRYGIPYTGSDAPVFALNVQAAIMIGSMLGSTYYGKLKQLEVRTWDRDYIDDLSSKFRNTELHPNITKAGLQLTSKVKDLGGLYNCVTTSQAPTGSTSQLLHVSSTGVEPYFSMVQNRRVRTADGGWKEFTLVPLEFYDYTEPELDWIEEQTAHHVSPEQQIKILEAVQIFCHTGVSKTINMPASATVEDVKAVIMRAKDSNLKGLTIFRDSSMEGVLKNASETRNKVKGIEKEDQPDRPEVTTTKVVQKEPITIEYETQTDEWKPLKTEIRMVSNFKDQPSRRGTTYKFSGPSPLYITANFDDSGELMEIFVNSTKPGTTVSAMCNAVGRLISVSLQHDPAIRERLIKTLSDMSSDGMWTNKIIGRACSIPAAVAKVLQHHNEYAGPREEGEARTIKDYEADGFFDLGPEINKMESSYSDCPNCGNMALRRSGGCSTCTSCGYSSC